MSDDDCMYADVDVGEHGDVGVDVLCEVDVAVVGVAVGDYY